MFSDVSCHEVLGRMGRRQRLKAEGAEWRPIGLTSPCPLFSARAGGSVATCRAGEKRLQRVRRVLLSEEESPDLREEVEKNSCGQSLPENYW